MSDERACLLCDIAQKKEVFKKPVVDAYYHVGEVLDLERQIEEKQTELNSCGTDDVARDALSAQLQELRSKHQKMQSTINNELNFAVGVLGETIEMCKNVRNSYCGHKDVDAEKPCPKCEENEELLKIARENPLEWLQQVTPKNRFTVLFFYRGTWCGNCPLYLRMVNDTIMDIRSLGGEAFAISSQEQEYIDQMKNTVQVDYDLVSDSKCILGKQFGVKITKKNGFAFKVMQRIIKGALKSTDSYDKYHEDGITQPAVIVIDRSGSVIYKWITPALFKTGFGMFDRIEPEEVLDVVKFYYSKPTLVASVVDYCNSNRAKMFELTLSRPDLRKLFEEHLNREFSSESLEFLDQVDSFKQLLEKKGIVLSMKGAVKKKEKQIYATYIPERAPKELNLPGEVRKIVSEGIEDKQKKKVNSIEEHVFGVALQHVKTMLMTDSFMRFVRKEQFIAIAPQIIGIDQAK